MALFESKYGVITQTDEFTYLIGNYQVSAFDGSWRLSPIAKPTQKTWLQSYADFDTVEDAIRVAIVFNKEDSIANGLKDMMFLFANIKEGK